MSGPDGALWFVESNADKIGRFDPMTHVFTEYSIPTANGVPAMLTVGSDRNLWFTEFYGNKIGQVVIAAAPPASITVPAGDADGSYTVSWAASATAGVTYQLEESTNSGFSTVRSAYSGTGLSASITGRGPGNVYYYRVRASKTGVLPSVWRIGGNGCVVPPAAPASITVPATDADGSYTVSWAASPTAGVTYQLEESTASGFSTVRSAYSGTGLSASITGRGLGNVYYYRVRATKAGLPPSAWRTGANGCAVPPAAPASITVPVSDDDGSYTVSWGASATAGVTYQLEESTNSGFSTVRSAYSGTGLSAPITGRVLGNV